MEGVIGATEFREAPFVLQVILWAEVVAYIGTLIYKIVEEFYRPAMKWTYVDGRLNTYIWHREQKGNKAHTLFALMLGIVALNGAVEGKVTRFEMEFIFISLATITWMVLTIIPPSKRILLKAIPIVPEFYFMAAMSIFYYDWIRPEVFGLCIAIILVTLILFFRNSSQFIEETYTFERFNADKEAAKPDSELKAFDPRRPRETEFPPSPAPQSYTAE
ncbi:MAG: hypothetical protein AAGH53_11415 [Pseudomonadota bacterium]